MGWCTDFAHRIQADCDHPMTVADEAACSCTSCGAVCKGRFPTCAEVWASGPKPVALLAVHPGNDAGAIPGGVADARPVETISRGGPPAPPTAANGHEAEIYERLDAVSRGMNVLSDRITQATDAWAAGNREVDLRETLAQMITAVQALPGQIAQGLSAALEIQHQQILLDVRQELREASLDATRPVAPETTATSKP